MTTNVKLVAVGGFTGIVLPQEVLDRLQVSNGDLLHMVDTPNGVELMRIDPELITQLTAAQAVMNEDGDVLKRLAE